VYDYTQRYTILLCKVKANGVGQTKNVIKNKQQTDKNKAFSLDIGLKLLILVVESKNISFIILM
jgi:hypothetical protein